MTRAERRYKRRLLLRMLMRTWPWRAWQIAYGDRYFITPTDRVLTPEQLAYREVHREIRRDLGRHETPPILIYDSDLGWTRPKDERPDKLVNELFEVSTWVPKRSPDPDDELDSMGNATGNNEYIYEDGVPRG